MVKKTIHVEAFREGSHERRSGGRSQVCAHNCTISTMPMQRLHVLNCMEPTNTSMTSTCYLVHVPGLHQSFPMCFHFHPTVI